LIFIYSILQVVVMRGLLQLLVMGALAAYKRNSFTGPTWSFRCSLFLVKSNHIILF
jgi:hypothetical protein